VITEGILPTVATGKKIISLEPSTGSVKWLRVSNTLGPVERSTGLRSEEPRTDMIAATPQSWAFTPQVVVSPNGKYLAIRTHSYLDPEDSENIGDQRVGITVLNAETGETVRTVEVSGLVLGQALTNDSLAVETAQNYYPAGTGVINAFSLSKAQAEPFRQEQVRAQRESESIGEGRRDCLQLVADRGIWGLRQRQAFGSALQGLIDDLLSPPAVRQLARADDICDERVGDIHSFTITLVIPRIQGISRNGCCPPLPTASLSRPCTRASTSTVPEPGSLAG